MQSPKKKNIWLPASIACVCSFMIGMVVYKGDVIASSLSVVIGLCSMLLMGT